MSDEDFTACCGAYLDAAGRAPVDVPLMRDLERQIVAELDIRGDTAISWNGAAWAVYRSLDPRGEWRVAFTCMYAP